jgi:hypothetical protein
MNNLKTGSNLPLNSSFPKTEIPSTGTGKRLDSRPSASVKNYITSMVRGLNSFKPPVKPK